MYNGLARAQGDTTRLIIRAHLLSARGHYSLRALARAPIMDYTAQRKETMLWLANAIVAFELAHSSPDAPTSSSAVNIARVASR